MSSMDVPKTMLSLQGIAASPGLVGGPAFVWKKGEVHIPRRTGCDPASESQRLQGAVDTACGQIRGLSGSLSEKHAEEAAVFDAHLMLVQDKSLRRKVNQAMETGINAEAAWADAVQQFAGQLEKLPDPTLSLRAADLRDVGERVLRILTCSQDGANAELRDPVIFVARDLAPSETVSLDKSKILAFCTAEGGATSHTAILSKALGLPAVVGLGDSILNLENGTNLFVDGSSGSVIVNPDKDTQVTFLGQIEEAHRAAQVDKLAAHQPAVTLDGFRVEVVANVGNVADTSKALEYGAEGIGLLRTEFLFLQRTASPGEEDQFETYRQILDLMEDRPVVVRTLDAGGDKEMPYLQQEKEANPFLGWRAIRICLANPELFKTQLRALLRAGPGHDLRIMFPMIASLEEIRAAKQLLKEAHEELKARGLPSADRFQVGIMVEIPSTVVLADLFAREVDFFSIGTNDLTQYSLAADRTNPKLAYLSDHCHPAVIRQIRTAVKAAHDAGLWIGVCGEMAGDPDAIPILLGLGLDELSMSPGLIPGAKRIIRSWNRADAVLVAEACLQQDTPQAVRQLVRSS